MSASRFFRRIPTLRLRPALLAVALCVGMVVPAAGDRHSERRFADAGPEPMLALILQEVRQQRLDNALRLADQLAERYPDFLLGHLVRGDLLLARARPLTTLGNVPHAPQARLRDLREEAVARLAAFADKPAGERLPRHLLRLRADQQHAIVVDTRRSRLYLYANTGGVPRLAGDFYISQGRAGSAKQREGDLKTPLGVYHVTSHIPREKLSDFYGSGAFPINYPNDWDRRSGRTGHGIWLHGTPPGSFSRPPKASEGCVVLANPDLEALGQSLQVGITPVVIADGIEWMSEREWQRERDSLLQAIESWRRDWENRDMDRYLAHYARNFETNGQRLPAFAQAKRQVNQTKTSIEVGIENLSMFANPAPDDFVVVSFDQDYRSNNLANRMRKQQYWIREDGRWKIVFEGNA